MIDIKNMSTKEIEALIDLLKQEIRSRNPLAESFLPLGKIKLTLESWILNEKNKVLQNEPKTILWNTSNSQDVDHIFNQDEFYIVLVNQLVDHFKHGMWENGTGPLKLTYNDKARLRNLKCRIQAYCPQISDNDIELLDKIIKILGA